MTWARLPALVDFSKFQAWPDDAARLEFFGRRDGSNPGS